MNQQADQTTLIPDDSLRAMGIPESLLEPRTETAPQSSYAMGYTDTFMELLTRRDADRNAAHLLPHLQPGMSLLDLGCGPGSITAGLTEAVYPGQVTGLDMSQAQVQAAQDRAGQLGLDNTSFTQGDALQTGLPNGHFDVVHCHGFLMHSPSIRDQLAEILRVLKPGGILSSRDMDVPTSFIAPAKHSTAIFKMLADVVRQEGGNPKMSQHLRTLMLNAGFNNVETGYSADFFGTRDELDFLRRLLLEWALSREFAKRTGRTGTEFGDWKDQVERWSRHPGAVGCFHFGWALGRKPTGTKL